MRVFRTSFCLLIAAILSSAPALAQDAGKNPEAVIEEMTSDGNTVTDQSGETEAATGEAAPPENWFGCPPEESKLASKRNTPCEDKADGAEGASQREPQ